MILPGEAPFRSDMAERERVAPELFFFGKPLSINVARRRRFR